MKYLIFGGLALLANIASAQQVDSIAIAQVDSLIQVSRELTASGEFDQALEVNATAEKLALEKFGRESALYGNCCFNRGRVYDSKSDYAEAEKWYLEAMTIREIALGKTHVDYAANIYTLAALNSLFGYYEKAEPLYIEAIAIGENVFGRQHLEVAKYISGLAGLYSYKSDYGRAEVLILEAIAIRENISGKDDISYANSLFSLGNLNLSLGDYRKAEHYHLEVKDFYERKFGKESTAYCSSLVNLANIYFNMNKFEKAELYFIEAKNIFELKLKIRLNPFYINCLGNLGRMYRQMGKYNEAEVLLLEVKNIFEQELANRIHPYYTTSLRVLADIYNNMGNYEKAEKLYLESKDIFEKTLGNDAREYASTLHNLSNFYERQLRFSESEPLLKEEFIQSYARLVKATSFLSEQDLAKYTTPFQSSGGILSSYLLARSTDGGQTGILPSLAFDHALFHKGFLLTAASRLNAPILASPETVEINIRLKSYRRRLSTEYTKPIADRKGIAELEEKANLAEKELARSVAGYADALRQVKWQDVKSILKPSEAAIEFVHFKVNFPTKTDSTMYAALLILPGSEQPKFIPLFEAKNLEQLVNSNTERKADYVNELYTLADRGLIKLGTEKSSLYELIWKPLEADLSGIKTIYYSPSGLLHRINIDAIPVSEMETIADKYQLISLNSTRQLVIPTQIKKANKDAVLFGGIQFDQDSTIQNNEPLLASRSRGDLSFTSVDSTLRGGTWNYLAGTEREVNAIEKIMQTSGVNTTLKKGYEATEETFKNIGINNPPSPRILHIATHGYFFPDPKINATGSGLDGEQESVFKISDHPMLRSGLIMAGGNTAWQGNQTLEGREDGILTAYEISQMNLSNTELVVLSACETGLGEIQGNEGVYGLQRAFKIAGAKYLIMSLWQVPDKQTSLLMTTFYKKWLEEKMTIPEAFHAAQKQLREIGLDPYQWAGFVLVE